MADSGGCPPGPLWAEQVGGAPAVSAPKRAGLLRPPHLSQRDPHPLMRRLKTSESSLTLLSHPTSKPSASLVGFPLKYVQNLTFPLVLTVLTWSNPPPSHSFLA